MPQECKSRVFETLKFATLVCPARDIISVGNVDHDRQSPVGRHSPQQTPASNFIVRSLFRLTRIESNGQLLLERCRP
ncbi:MAG: hypothetical protein ACI9CO_002178 [Candidatus Azotimanducaceae bacterium]